MSEGMPVTNMRRKATEITRPQMHRSCMAVQTQPQHVAEDHNTTSRANTIKRLRRYVCSKLSIRRSCKTCRSQKSKLRIRHINALLADLPAEAPVSETDTDEESASPFSSVSSYDSEDDTSTIKPSSLVSEDLHDLLLDSLPRVLNEFNYLARHQRLYVHLGTHLAPSPEALCRLPNAPSYYENVVSILNEENDNLDHQDPDNKSCRFHQAFRDAAQHPVSVSVDSYSPVLVHENLTPELLEESFRVYSRRAALQVSGEAADLYRFSHLDHWEQYARIVQEDKDHILYWEPFTDDDDEDTMEAWRYLNYMNARTMQMWFVFIRSPMAPDCVTFEHGFHYKLKKGALGLLERNVAQLAVSGGGTVDESAMERVVDGDEPREGGVFGTVIRWINVLENANAAARSSIGNDSCELPSTLM